jgi:hypothetical protein
MNSSSPSAEYVSHTEWASAVTPGVHYKLLRMSFARRLDLVQRVRSLAQHIEFLEAGGEMQDKIEGSLLAAQIDRMYLEWGLQSVDGLAIDGEPATPSSLIEKGPEALAQEIVGRIRAECHLSEDERKN